MKKPRYLYHASSNKNILMFEPRAMSVRDVNEGPVVFASSDKILSSIFIVKTDDSWCESGLFNGIHYFLCNDKKRFIQTDHGGAIYKLSSDNFTTDPLKGLGSREWVSKNSVKVLEKELYDSGLEAMLDFGVQVYFVDKTMFNEILSSSDHGYLILKRIKSINQIKNINPKKL